MNLSQLQDLVQVEDVPSFIGYPATNARAPYTVIRPFITDPTTVSVAGDAIDWDERVSIYCAGQSVEASYNTALDVMRKAQGSRVDDVVLDTSMSYVGLSVEGHYETLVIIQAYRGGI